MKIGKLHITWAKTDRRDWQAQVDALRLEQEQQYERLTALSESQFKLLADALTGNVGLGFQKRGDITRY